ncbi:MAG: hypothetical protein IH614_00700, partial [Desulfuromonadales bacterium]|nr:hypothetical protein [Desulfuromonadales bacterium]
GYGRTFLRSLPPARVAKGATVEVFAAMEGFLAEPSTQTPPDKPPQASLAPGEEVIRS